MSSVKYVVQTENSGCEKLKRVTTDAKLLRNIFNKFVQKQEEN